MPILTPIVGGVPVIGPVLGGTGGTTSPLPPVLGDPLGTLLGSTQLTQLDAVTAALNSGAVPSANTLAPLTTIFGSLTTAPSLAPADQATIILSLLSAASGGDPAAAIPLPLLAPVTNLLMQLAVLPNVNLASRSRRPRP